MSRLHVLCDIDHVISASWRRDPMIGTVSWDEYHGEGVNDLPVRDVVQLLQRLQKDYKIIMITARPEKWRTMTMGWLVKHNVPVDEILMRPDNAFRPAPEIKLELVNARFPDKDDIAFLLDDRDDVILAFFSIGVTCMKVFGRRQEEPYDGAKGWGNCNCPG
jgi:hypothetical protein